jgi:large subunit ribosomal protein L17
MRKKVFGRQFKRTTNQRKALFKSLTQALVLHGRIKTTEAKAKSIKGEVEKLITYAKNKKENAPQNLQRHVDMQTAL